MHSSRSVLGPRGGEWWVDLLFIVCGHLSSHVLGIQCPCCGLGFGKGTGWLLYFQSHLHEVVNKYV